MNYYTPKTKVFVSFDFDHDEDLKHLFVGQAKHDDTPFEISDLSVKQALLGEWLIVLRFIFSNNAVFEATRSSEKHLIIFLFGSLIFWLC